MFANFSPFRYSKEKKVLERFCRKKCDNDRDCVRDLGETTVRVILNIEKKFQKYLI